MTPQLSAQRIQKWQNRLHPDDAALLNLQTQLTFSFESNSSRALSFEGIWNFGEIQHDQHLRLKEVFGKSLSFSGPETHLRFQIPLTSIPTMDHAAFIHQWVYQQLIEHPRLSLAEPSPSPLKR